MPGYQAPYGPPAQPAAYPMQSGTPAPPVEKGRWRRFLPIVSMVMVLISILLSASALNSSVYNIHASGTVWFISIEVDETLYYDHIDNQNSMATSNTTTYDEMKFYNVKDQVEQYYLLVAAGTVMMAVTMVLSLFVLFRKLGPVPVGIIGIIAAIMCLLGPILLSAGLPAAVDADSKSSGTDLCNQYQGENTPCKSFSGQSNVNTGSLGVITMTWGPTNGYNLSIVSSVLALIGAIFIFPSPRPVKRTAQAQQMMQAHQTAQPYYGNVTTASPPPPQPQQALPQYRPQSQTYQPAPTPIQAPQHPGEGPPEGPPPDLPPSMDRPQYGTYPQQRPPPGPGSY